MCEVINTKNYNMMLLFLLSKLRNCDLNHLTGRVFHILYGIFFILSLSLRPSGIMLTRNNLIKCGFIREPNVYWLFICLILMLFANVRCFFFIFWVNIRFRTGFKDLRWNSWHNLPEKRPKNLIRIPEKQIKFYFCFSVTWSSWNEGFDGTILSRDHYQKRPIQYATQR